MPWTEILKVSQIAILVVFAAIASDFRKKDGMVPLIDPRLTTALRLVLLIPVLIFGYTILMLERHILPDYVSVVTTLIGLFIVIKAKYDLGKSHTWIGYHGNGNSICTKGIYSYIRHPIYAGVCIFIIGGSITVLFHAELFLIILGAISISFIIVFLNYAATLESRRLNKMHGTKYGEYRMQVHSCLPIRKYKTSIKKNPK